ncbi:MAG: ATP-binding protein [Dysgonamonadaceae bacterium]|jgi:AAA+ ATPase superfamily predicted ATPase|nr:ATP-binding protein [Dysgonamonadaceae bacterium]
MINPFITNGYAGAKYFCDREQETQNILSMLQNGNNLAVISPRRLGKTDLLRHCFSQEDIKKNYYCFIIDIYATRSLSDLVNKMGKEILDVLKSKGKKALTTFVQSLKSLKSEITFDINGNPSWSVGLGQISNPETTLDEIFQYLNAADKRCFVAIDEFQQITKYAESNVEATLRTYVQYCSNAQFVFAGSQRHLMGTMFTSPSRPFYQSVTVMNLEPIPLEKYKAFAQKLFRINNKQLDTQVVDLLYNQFDGITFYLQKVLNILFMNTEVGETCNAEMIDAAVKYIIDFTATTYDDLLYQLPDKQKQVLVAISKTGKAKNILSQKFVRFTGLTSSSIKSAVKGLLEKDLVTVNKDIYQVYDKFFERWIKNYNI